MNKDKLVKTLKTNIPLWNRYRRRFPCEANTLIDLRGVDLRGVDLRGVDLRWVDLRWANLQGADLRGADLRWANLRWADLRGADLRGADLRWADLQWVDLRGTDLRGANLRGANLRGANLDYSVLPLWCGSFEIKVSKDFTEQLLLHIYKLDSDHPEFSRVKEFIEPYIKNCATVIKHNIEF